MQIPEKKNQYPQELVAENPETKNISEAKPPEGKLESIIEQIEKIDDKKDAISEVKKNGYNLKYLSQKFRDDKDVVLEAVKQSDVAIEFASPWLRTDKEIVAEADKQRKAAYLDRVKQNAKNLEFAEHIYPEIKSDEKIILNAVKQYGLALQFAAPELQDKEEIVLTAIKQDGLALKFASPRLRAQRDIVLEAVKNDKWLLQYNVVLEYASTPLKNDRDIVTTAIKQNSFAFKYASDELRADPEIRKLAGLD